MNPTTYSNIQLGCTRALSASLRAGVVLGPFVTVAAMLAVSAPAPAHAMNRGAYTMEVLVDGAPLPEYLHRASTYVEALEGREYSIRLTNRTGERVAVALAVDGLNSIDAKTTTAHEAMKWILAPWQSITLDGWQTSSSTARRFYFTNERDSYAAWLGKTRNLGVISAAFFRERRPVPIPILGGHGGGARLEDPPSGPVPSESPAGAPRPQSEANHKSSARLSDELAATGIGREVDHRVRRIFFDEEDSPAAVLELRYEYRDALVKLGVLPRPEPRWEDPLARRERSHGFEDLEFAPDPYRRGRR